MIVVGPFQLFYILFDILLDILLSILFDTLFNILFCAGMPPSIRFIHLNRDVMNPGEWDGNFSSHQSRSKPTIPS